MKKQILYLVFFAGLLTLGCHKQPKPSFLGKWETVTTVGFKWEYDISSNTNCRKLPEYFGETLFCYPYDIGDDNTFVVHTPEPEVWEFNFVDDCGDVADVWVTLPDGEKQQFILKRIE